MRIWVDLTDVISHARYNARPTGIQRVVLELVASLRASGNEITPVCNFNSNPRNLTQLFVAVDETQVGDTVSDRFYKFVHGAGSFRPLEAIKQKLANLAPGLIAYRIAGVDLPALSPSSINPGDAVLFPGAFWERRGQLSWRKAADQQGARVFVVVHDVIAITDPDYAYTDLTKPFMLMFARPVHVITTSQATALALKERSGLPAPVSSTIIRLAHEFQGFERGAAPNRPSPHVSSAVGQKSFALTVGTVEVRKNHERLLSVWANLAKTRTDLPLLVVAGRRGWRAQKALNMLDSANRHGAPYLFLENVSDGDLAWLYANALFSVYPSLMEGWGLPVGESLWFGTPCLSSSVSSMPEVGGELCDYFDPRSEEDMARAIASMLDDPEKIRTCRQAIQSFQLRRWQEVMLDLRNHILTHRALRH